MTGFEVYKTYLAIKLHFTKDNYNYFTFHGKSRASESSFEKRKDRYFFKKLATKFDQETILQFFVSHFVENSNTWIGDLSVYNSSTFNAWKKKIQSMTFMFENDIDYLIDITSFEKIFDCKSGNHPILLQAYLGDRITLESMVILNNLVKYIPDFDKHIKEPVIWPDIRRKVVKYEPFLLVDKTKYKCILIEKLNGIL
mgnify:CR=1 FL=1